MRIRGQMSGGKSRSLAIPGRVIPAVACGVRLPPEYAQKGGAAWCFECVKSTLAAPPQCANLSRKAGGSGLGLVIVRTIVELHGGNVSVNSKLGVGTTVKVFLPTIDPKYATGEGYEADQRSAPLNAAS